MAFVINPINPIEPMDSLKKSSAVGASVEMPFEDLLKNAVNSLEEMNEVSAQDKFNLATGDVDDIVQMQINSMKATNMLQTTVQLTTRIVNAYKEIMQMQV